jgi:hypothetical protein
MCADHSASPEFNIPDLEIAMEDVSQPMDIKEEGAIAEAVLVPLRTLMYIDTTVGLQQMPSAAPTVVVESYAEKLCTRKPGGPYPRYTAHQIEQLFDYVIEQGYTAKDVALLTGINIRTAHRYIKNTMTMRNDVCRSEIKSQELDVRLS